MKIAGYIVYSLLAGVILTFLGTVAVVDVQVYLTCLDMGYIHTP